MKIALGSDKSGFTLKEAIKAHLEKLGHEVLDIGTREFEKGIPFYEVAPKAAALIQSGEFERGILCCGTGMGMAVVANKFKGICAAPVESVYAARKCRVINNANILALGGWILGEMMAADIVDEFLRAEFTEGLEEWRREFLQKAQGKIRELEEEKLK